ncbi:MAG: hypothetical protein ACTHNU_11110 [Gaiellales bacterium]
MTDEHAIEEIAGQLRSLPLLTAPEDIRRNLRERIAEVELHAPDSSLSARLAALSMLPAPPQLDELLSQAERPVGSRPRAARWFRELLPARSTRRRAVSIAAVAAAGLAAGVGALALLHQQVRSSALTPGLRSSETVYASGALATVIQPHLRPRLTIRVHVDSQGVSWWYPVAYNRHGAVVKPTCSSPDGGAPVAATSAPVPAGTARPAYKGGSVLKCTADVGQSVPVQAVLTVGAGPGGSSGSSGSSSTSTDTGTSTGTTSGSTTGTTSGTTDGTTGGSTTSTGTDTTP